MKHSRIKKLPKNVYDKIAAGEIIDRPSSILRELLDNSIDSGATEIIINLVEGGHEVIEVIDNGIGMNEIDVKLCCEPFTTSKILYFEDLLNLNTYGFRGEALNSISTISRVEIISKSSEEEMATNYLIEGGEELAVSKCSRNRGTTIIVSNIFFNIPARKKSMKSSRSEYNSCREVVLNKVFPNNEITFKLFNNGEKKLELLSEYSLTEKLKTIHGKNYIENLLKVKGLINSRYGDLILNGYIGKPDFNRPKRNHQWLFINSRPIYSPVIMKGIYIAYQNTVPKGRYPIVYLFIDLPKDFIDINVHPAKKEIKFIDENIVISLIISAIRKVLNENIIIPDLGDKISETIKFREDEEALLSSNANINIDSLNILNSMEETSIDNIIKSNETEKSDFDSTKELEDIKSNVSVSYRDFDNENFTEISPIIGINYRILGNLFKKYILLESNDEFIIIDQHLAHERINYEKLKSKYKNSNIEVQNLMIPILIEVIQEDIDEYLQKDSLLKKFGFEIDSFGSNAIAIRSIPSFIRKDSNHNTLLKIIDEIVNKKIGSVVELMDKSILLEASYMSIKGGDFQSKENISSLVTDLFKYSNPYSYLHGKSTAIKFKKKDIDKFFENH